MSSTVTHIFHWRKLIAWTACALVAGSQQAATPNDEPRWFEVEIIVFKDPSATGVEELWPDKMKRNLPDNTKDIALEELFPTPENFVETNANGTSLTEPLPADGINTSETDDPAVSEETGISPFTLLTAEQLQMSSIFQSLSRSSRYRTLSHFGWRQPVAGKSEAEWVRIIGGTDYSEQFTLTGSSVGEQALLVEMGITTNSVSALLSDRSTENPLASNNTANGTTDLSSAASNTSLDPSQAIDTLDKPQLPQYIPVPEVDGAIQIYLSRYLHINTQLYFRKPGKTEVDIGSINANLSSSLLDLSDDGVIDSNFETGFSWNFDTDNLFEPQPNETVMIDALQDYIMQQSRRIRSGEIHYFDHPLFGIIIQVRPFDPEAEQNLDTENSPE